MLFLSSGCFGGITLGMRQNPSSRKGLRETQMESLHEMENEEDGYLQKYRALSFLTQSVCVWGLQYREKGGRGKKERVGNKGQRKGRVFLWRDLSLKVGE